MDTISWAEMHVTSPNVVQSARGRCEARVMSSRLLETTVSGYLDIRMVDWLIALEEQWLDMGGQRLQVFHDWEAGTDYDAEIRTRFTEWSNRHRSRFDRVHILVKSKTGAWGIRLYNNLTGGITTTYSSRAAFEAERDRARAGLR